MHDDHRPPFGFGLGLEHSPKFERESVDPAPSPDEIREALEHLEGHTVPGTPDVRHLKTLEAAGITAPLEVGYRTIKSYSVTHGKPRHGELRSDDHVSGYHAVVRRDCPECPWRWAEYEYDAYHHISGSESLTCQNPNCEHTYRDETWE